MPDTRLYDSDFFAWTQDQASRLRRLAAERSNVDLDLENLAEEIESMGRSEQQQLESRLTVLLLHLLKWRFQPGLRGNGWRLTIKEQRNRIERHLRKNPSLKAMLDETIVDAYSDALIGAERETGLPETTFPKDCPWSFDQLMDDGFLPEA
ncbi:hypothetical protein ABAZ39_18945 (plasmid) [Azospirillum argentinense]|uniref:DUF29 domain-containing protein n=1 Tax=Azospirillum argentinense TaxID=2970906 RepID=A0A060DIU1_9PROT|nr:DUF29 domain-containing protein [Azospirillum argentinense]AIB14006.1 hypothetical protein ABAZ39_18945 [Azospirillum argentinense]EZQ05733.1 hypothetical protein ABAZ39_19160 [Azospirillum argentinense]